MSLFYKLKEKLDYLDSAAIENIRRAFTLSFQAHKGQKRSSGEPYITHPVEVACILAESRMDSESIMSALLHDVLEDTFVDKQTLAQEFNPSVADIVDGVSKLTQIEFRSRAEAQAENFRKMIMAMSKDLRVILVKLADRLHNMRTLDALPKRKRQRIAKETLEIFAPIAKRLGMRKVSIELEEISFMHLYPRRYRILSAAVQQIQGSRKQILHEIKRSFEYEIKKAKFGGYKIHTRQKHLYSIYKKMRDKRLSFSEITDVYAVRIRVDSIDACYRMLGIAHRLYKPLPERFKDYIALPKSNGYQSLHTILFGPSGVPIEVQIRTWDMDKVAKSGIAAHWLYKAGKGLTSEPQILAQQWVQNLLEMQKSTGSSIEFIENVKTDLFPNEVYVFTPKGGILELPSGATPIDFAYALHTNMGNTCVAARVDRQLISLSTPLENGQTIEIITMPDAIPHPTWLNFVSTAKAKTNIRHFLKHRQLTQSIVLGKKLLLKALLEQGMTIEKLNTKDINTVLKQFNLSSMQALYQDIGLGNRPTTLVAMHLSKKHNATTAANHQPTQDSTPLSIKGTEGMVLHFATCCSPIPGDAIIALITQGAGLIVHREDCSETTSNNNNQSMPVRWADDVQGTFCANLTITIRNQTGALATLSLAISDQHGNIEDISVKSREGNTCTITLRVFVKNKKHLNEIIKAVRRVKFVIKIERLTHI